MITCKTTAANQELHRGPRVKKEYKPGQGWKSIGSGVYEYKDRRRVHVNGLCRMPDGEWINAKTVDNYNQIFNLIRINGGSRKRGIMAWARRL